jgi:hypothetical protein
MHCVVIQSVDFIVLATMVTEEMDCNARVHIYINIGQEVCYTLCSIKYYRILGISN